MKFGQKLVQFITNVFILFSNLRRRLGTSSRSFYDFDKVAVQFAIFVYCLFCLFLVVDVY